MCTQTIVYKRWNSIWLSVQHFRISFTDWLTEWLAYTLIGWRAGGWRYGQANSLSVCLSVWLTGRLDKWVQPSNSHNNNNNNIGHVSLLVHLPTRLQRDYELGPTKLGCRVGVCIPTNCAAIVFRLCYEIFGFQFAAWLHAAYQLLHRFCVINFWE